MDKKSKFWGIIFILAAICLVLSRLGWIGDFSVIKMFLTVAIAIWFVNSIIHIEFAGIFFSTAFLAILYDDFLGITALTPFTVLIAAALLTAGCTMIFGKKKPEPIFYDSRKQEFAHVENSADGDNVYFKTTFSSGVKYINSNNFQSADIECNFGAAKVYFDNAIVQNGCAIVRIEASFSGVELYIPKEWTVVNAVKASFGGVSEKNSPLPNGIVNLTIQGNVSFAGITIIYI